jgi:hypothetical protein
VNPAEPRRGHVAEELAGKPDVSSSAFAARSPCVARVEAIGAAMDDALALGEIRKARGLTQADTSKVLKVSQATSPGSSTSRISASRRSRGTWRRWAASSS